MKANKTPTELLLYWLAFLLALALRLLLLGATPLTDLEAGWALQALGLAHGSVGVLGAQPAYILITSQLFSVLGSTNFIARLFPALVGSLMIWLPCFFRDWMGDSPWLHRAGLVMAFGLALDPALVSLSRQIGSPIPSITFILLTLVCLVNRHMLWAGICAGLALLSGPAFLQGMLILALSWALYRLALRVLVKSHRLEEAPAPSSAPLPAPSLGVGISAFVVTLLVAGTLFMRAPQGLGALADTITSYLKTWVLSSGIPILRPAAGLLVYLPLVIIFGVIGAVRPWIRAWELPHARQAMLGLSILAFVAFLLPWFYVGRQVGDMAWAIIPLWALAALEISRSLLFDEDLITHLVAAGLGIFLFLLAVVGWMNLLFIGRFQVSLVIYWAVIIGAFLLGLIAFLLVTAGWSSKAAKLGAVWSLCVVLGLQLFSNTWGMAIVHQDGAQELWSIPPTTGQADLLLGTLTDLSTWNTGLRDQLDIVVLADSPSLKWALRNFPNTRYESVLSAAESPAVVITQKGADQPSLTEKYRGQDFVWQLYPGWQGVFPPNFINWLAFRQAPLLQDQIILWARADIFPVVGSDSGSANP